MDLSIIIVNYNTRELTSNAIQSVLDSVTDISFEIILIDNNSSDDSVEYLVERFPTIQIIRNSLNEGFSKANNQAIQVSTSRYVLLLNSDTIIQSDTLETMVRFMDRHPEIGASGCKVELPDGTLDKACKRGFPTPTASFYYSFGIAKLFPNIPKFNGYQLGYLNPAEEYPIDCLVGAFMLVRRTTIDQVGLLDEDYFMYGEDVDWCYRIKQSGWQIYYYPRTKIIHYKGGSSRKKPFKIIYEFHRAMILFHKKHYSKRYSTIINALVYSGIYLKLGLSIVKSRLVKLR